MNLFAPWERVGAWIDGGEMMVPLGKLVAVHVPDIHCRSIREAPKEPVPTYMCRHGYMFFVRTNRVPQDGPERDAGRLGVKVTREGVDRAPLPGDPRWSVSMPDDMWLLPTCNLFLDTLVRAARTADAS